MIYSPKYFQSEDKQRVLKFIRENSFATVISCEGGQVSNISKIPLMLKEDGELFLEGHIARANPHWRILRESAKCIVIFDGAHDYISPSWYENPEIGVPTWNYSTAIVDGSAEVIDSQEWLLRSVMELSSIFEKGDDWRKNADKTYLDNLSKGIVGIKININEIHSKFKLSQHQDKGDRDRTIKNLRAVNPSLADVMENWNK